MPRAGAAGDDFEDADLTPRWWLDRDDPERAAALLRSGDSVPTTEAEHRLLAAELAARRLVCIREDGQTWVWTPREAEELLQISPATASLDDERLPPRRGGASASRPDVTTGARTRQRR